MTNEKFLLMTNEEKNVKFRNALKEKSDNHLSDEEISYIISHISLNQQYIVRIYREPMNFLTAIAVADSHDSHTIFGSALAGAIGMSMYMFNDEKSAAVITHADHSGKRVCIIHIYIPLSQI